MSTSTTNRRGEIEAVVQACYATWSERYYDDYCGSRASYPPVHYRLVCDLLVQHQARTVLDAGCGPASLLRELVSPDRELYGFDLTDEMVVEARRVLTDLGLDPKRVWQGSVCDPGAFHAPDGTGPVGEIFDAVLCIGVLPHVRAEDEAEILANVHRVLRPGGLAIFEARNALFSLFTFNRLTYRFLAGELIGEERRAPEDAEMVDQALQALQGQLRMDLPPRRPGHDGAQGYDEIPSRCHNPLLAQKLLAAAGFADVRLLFYHYHCLPPMFESIDPETFCAGSLAREDPEDWRGHFMASAFLVTGRRP